MITNIADLRAAIGWLNRNGYTPQDMDDFLQYTHRVKCLGYSITAGATYEWRVNVSHPGVAINRSDPHNTAYHLQVAPWVAEECLRLEANKR